MKVNRNSGFAPVLILVLLAVLIVVAAAGSYYLLKRAGKAPGGFSLPFPTATSQPNGSPEPVSDSTDIDVIEKEINQTDVGSPDTDLKNLDSSASSL